MMTRNLIISLTKDKIDLFLEIINLSVSDEEIKNIINDFIIKNNTKKRETIDELFTRHGLKCEENNSLKIPEDELEKTFQEYLLVHHIIINLKNRVWPHSPIFLYKIRVLKI